MPLKRKISPPIEDHENLNPEMTPGKKLVFDLFNEHLPLDWEIYIQPHLNGLRPDFVLMSPQRGIAVFEVKDWDLNAMDYFTDEDKWEHEQLWKKENKEVKFIQNPIIKIDFCKEEILDLYCPGIRAKNGKVAWDAITTGIIFPFAQKKQINKLMFPFIKYPNFQYKPISGIEAISTENIKNVFPRFKCADSPLMTKEFAKDLRGWMGEPDIKKIKKILFKLNKKQQRLSETRTKNGYRRIKGSAGSGKSLLLAARAAKLASEGKSVLVVTFNITLLNYLHDLVVRALLDLNAPIKNSLDNIKFNHFHRWCKNVCYNVGWDKRYKNIKDYLSSELPLLTKEAFVQHNAPKYDAILVDEGQDYNPLWWDVLSKACKPDGEMILVADATQDIYGKAKTWTDEVMTGAGFSGLPSKLIGSYRLPVDAISVVRKFAKEFIDSADLPQPVQGEFGLEPCQLRWVQCNSVDSKEVCVNETKSLMQKIDKNPFANEDITIITTHIDSGKEIVKRFENNNISVCHTFGKIDKDKNTDDGGDEKYMIQSQKMAFFMANEKIKATTIHSFKGWECPNLVMHVAGLPDKDSFLALVYTGLTRLKRHPEGSCLTVVCSASMLSAYGKTWPNYEEI